MSDEREQQEAELKEMEQQLIAEKDEQTRAATAVAEPEPEVTPEPTAPDPVPAESPVAPQPSVNQNPDDPMEWAKKKGLTSPEAIARSLQQMEHEFHKRNQQGHPGYQDVQNGNPAPPPPPPPQQWTPQPQGYGYPPPMPPMGRNEMTQQLARESNLDPEDVERLAPFILRLADAAASRRNQSLERELDTVRRQSARNAELMQLAQDPAFGDPRVVKEMHEVLKDGSHFQRGGSYAQAFNQALSNLARKQLQQSAPNGNHQTPPVTAGGGSGVAYGPTKITEAMFNSWSVRDQQAYLESNGKVLPKKK